MNVPSETFLYSLPIQVKVCLRPWEMGTLDMNTGLIADGLLFYCVKNYAFESFTLLDGSKEQLSLQ